MSHGGDEGLDRRHGCPRADVDMPGDAERLSRRDVARCVVDEQGLAGLGTEPAQRQLEDAAVGFGHAGFADSTTSSTRSATPSAASRARACGQAFETMAVRIRPPSLAMQPRSCSSQDHRAAMSARSRSSVVPLMPRPGRT